MKLKIVVIDFEPTRRTKFVGAFGATLLAAGALAVAGVALITVGTGY